MKIKASKALSPFFLDGWSISKNLEFDVDYVEPRQFLKAERLDLVSKLYYIECREKGNDCTLAKELYTEFIRAFSLGSFIEPGTETKDSIEKYFEEFDILIDNVKEIGLSANKSVIPVGENGSILDGSHRTALAIYFGKKLPVIYISGVTKTYDYMYFKDRGMPQKYLDFAVQKYIEYADLCYVACLWPRARGANKQKKVEMLIHKSTNVVCKRQIKLNYNGLRQLMIQIYGNQEWAGTMEDGFSGIPVKAKACYDLKGLTTVYVLEGNDLEHILELKAQIRDIFKINNHSIHITDTKEEAMEAARILFNEHSIALLKFGNIIVDNDIKNHMITKEINLQENCLSCDFTKMLFQLIKINQIKTLWMKIDKNSTPIDFGYVYGMSFPSLEKCNLSIKERICFHLKCFRYGCILDFAMQLQIKRKIRQLVGMVLRKIGVIR